MVARGWLYRLGWECQMCRGSVQQPTGLGAMVLAGARSLESWGLAQLWLKVRLGSLLTVYLMT